MPTVSPLGANSDVLSFAIASSIAALRSGVSSRSPSGAAKTRLSTLPCSEANCDSMRSVALLRVGARDLELVLEAAADCRDEQDEDGDDPDPAEDDLPRVDWRTSASSARDRRSTVVRVPRVVPARTCPKPPGWSLRVTTRLRVESHRSNWTACASPTVLPIRSRSARSRPLSFGNSARLTSDADNRAARGRLRHPRPDPSRRSSGAVRSRLCRPRREHGGRRRLRRGGRRPGCGDGRRARASPGRGDETWLRRAPPECIGAAPRARRAHGPDARSVRADAAGYSANSSGSPKRGNSVAVSRKKVSSTMRPFSISSTCSAHGS